MSACKRERRACIDYRTVWHRLLNHECVHGLYPFHVEKFWTFLVMLPHPLKIGRQQKGLHGLPLDELFPRKPEHGICCPLVTDGAYLKVGDVASAGGSRAVGRIHYDMISQGQELPVQRIV